MKVSMKVGWLTHAVVMRLSHPWLIKVEMINKMIRLCHSITTTRELSGFFQTCCSMFAILVSVIHFSSSVARALNRWLSLSIRSNSACRLVTLSIALSQFWTRRPAAIMRAVVLKLGGMMKIIVIGYLLPSHKLLINKMSAGHLPLQNWT